jgi:hypothetical protein
VAEELVDGSGRAGLGFLLAFLRAALGVLVGLAGTVCGAEPPPVVAGVQPLDLQQAAVEKLKDMRGDTPAAYVDKVMDSSTLPPLGAAEDAPVDTLGFRAWSVETRLDSYRADAGFGVSSSRELGQHLQYLHQTNSYGTFTAEVDWRHASEGADPFESPFTSNRGTGGRFTVRNSGFPITPRVLADSAVGDIYSEVTDALSRTYRLSFMSSVVRGAGLRVSDGESDLRLGSGMRGRFVGTPYAGFESEQGTLTWAGYSRRIAPELAAGIQVDEARGIPAWDFGNSAARGTEDSTSAALSLSYGGDLYAGHDRRARLIYVRSQTSGELPGRPGAADGIFAEGGLRVGSYRHEFGAYSASPNLRFGDSLLASGNRGAYWRVDSNTLRLSWGVGLELERQQLDAAAAEGDSRHVGLSANGQYRLSSRDLFGGSLTAGQTRYRSPLQSSLAAGGGYRSLDASAYYQTRFGRWAPSRFRVEVRRNQTLVANDVPATGEEFEWEQDWISSRYETMQPQLVTTLGVARDRSNGARETRPTAGVTFRIWPDADWQVSGTLRYTARDSHLSSSRGLSGTLTTEKSLRGGWRIGASISLNQARVTVPASSFTQPELMRSNDKTVSVFLRWEGAAGSTAAAVGTREPGLTGSGRVTGTVFLDGDRDGRQQAGEAGVAGIEVILDGRYRAVTGANGRFEFPLVATGRHQLTVTAESIPLPWGPGPGTAVNVDVPLRGDATASVPVVRVGE